MTGWRWLDEGERTLRDVGGEEGSTVMVAGHGGTGRTGHDWAAA